jgi:glycosyltransferase involved in cell wall biosynthesis
MKESRISVAMAVYDGEPFIGKQLDSILNQSRVPDEIIICDDSRNDKTYSAIENIIARYPEIIKYSKNETQLGVSKNFERAISLTGGDIIFLSDQDDVWMPDKVERLVSLINASPNCGGAFCNSELVDENLSLLNVTHWQLRGFGTKEMLSYTTGGMMEFFLKRVPIAGHNMAFKAEFKDLILPLPDLKECHDTWIGLIIAATNKWAFTNACLTKFRQHNSNLSQASRGGQLKAALDSIKNDTSTWYAILYNELIDRLEGKAEPDILELLKDRCGHSAARAKLNCNIFKRFPIVCKEIKNKRYFKYGRGWKSIIQDIFLRSIV